MVGYNINEITKIIRTAYDVRSNIVHKGVPYVDSYNEKARNLDITSDRFIEKLREITRDVIVKLIERMRAKSFNLQQACDDLEKEIIEDIQLSH